jgi:DNA-binding Lrp family transcriptional regulator
MHNFLYFFEQIYDMDKNGARLDRKDRRLLYHLSLDCRRPAGEIAKACGLSKQAAYYRINRLVENGTIKAFITAINTARLGYSNFEAWMQLDAMAASRKEELLSHLRSHPSVRLVGECGGRFDLLVGILAESPAHFSSIFGAILRRFPKTVRAYSVSMPVEFYAYPRAYLLDKGAGRKPHSLGGVPQKARLGKTDLAILAAIANDARIPVLELASKAGVSPNTARARLSHLKRSGIIDGYTLVPAHSKIGYENYEILASLANMDEGKEREMESFCAANPHTTFFLRCVGKWGVDVGFDCKNAAHFQQILAEFRSRFSGQVIDFEYASIAEWLKFTYYPFAQASKAAFLQRR